MTDYVVDTDVVSYGFRQDTRFDYYRPLLQSNRAFVSFMTVAELDFWQNSRNWGPRRRQQLANYVGQHFAMYPVTRKLCTLWALVKVECSVVRMPGLQRPH